MSVHYRDSGTSYFSILCFIVFYFFCFLFIVKKYFSSFLSHPQVEFFYVFTIVKKYFHIRERRKEGNKVWNEQEVKTVNEKQVMKIFDFNKFYRKLLPTLVFEMKKKI